MLVSVVDDGPTLGQHRGNALCLVACGQSRQRQLLWRESSRNETLPVIGPMLT